MKEQFGNSTSNKDRSSDRKEFDSVKVVIAGGGTGGHLFSGIAIAESFMGKNNKNEAVFLGTGNAFEKYVLSKTSFRQKTITAAAIKGQGIWKQFISCLKFPWGVLESVFYFLRDKGDVGTQMVDIGDNNMK